MNKGGEDRALALYFDRDQADGERYAKQLRFTKMSQVPDSVSEKIKLPLGGASGAAASDWAWS